MKAMSFFLWAVAAAIPPRDYANRQYFLVEMDTSQNTSLLHTFIDKYRHVFRFEHAARAVDDHFVFSKASNDFAFLGNFRSDPEHVMRRDGHEADYDALVGHPGVRSIHMLPVKQLEKRLPVYIDTDTENSGKTRENSDDGTDRENSDGLKIVDSSQQPQKETADELGISDPLFLEQWHLINSQYPGHDVNVRQTWHDGFRGKGVSVAIIDDGLDYESEDLAANFNAKGSWDFNENSALPKPLLFDDYHGTRCAGEVAAVKNDVCGIGVAYEAQVAGIRILSAPITAEDEAAAMVYGLEHNDIYSCSWGPTDNGRTVAAPAAVVKKAMIRGVQDGRKEKGAVYVFASGNGGRVDDQCNFDGYTNSIYSITVGAIDHKGQHPSYAEACSAVMVVTYSSGSGEHIHTTDLHKKCSAVHGGTSAAAPLAAGVYALVLQANPDLTWRDVQYVSAYAAVPVNENDGDYQKTALGRLYSHKYGFGKIDAQKLVETALSWKNVKPQAWHYGDHVHVHQKVSAPEGAESDVIESSYAVSAQDLKVMNVERIEHVTVKVNIQSQNRGKLDVRLVSPSGLVSKLAWYRELDQIAQGLKDWTFMSVVHWGESGVGNWTLQVKSAAGNEITLDDWELRFFGEAIDAEKAEVYDLDADYAQVRRDRLHAGAASSSVPFSSTTSAPASASADVSSTTSAADVSSDISSLKIQTSSASGNAEIPTPVLDAPASSDPAENDHGAYKLVNTDHSWRYVLVFAIAMVFIVFVYVARWQSDRTSSRRRRGDYEFDIIPNEDYSSDDEPSFGSEPTERDAVFDDYDDTALPNYDEDAFQIGDEPETEQETEPATETKAGPEPGKTDE